MQLCDVTVLVLLSASWLQCGGASKCSLAVLDRVLQLYQKHHEVPAGIVANTIRLSPDVVVATTDGYFSDQEDLRCISTSWNKDAVFTSTLVYNTNVTINKAGTAITELPGQTYDSVAKVRRYHTPTRRLVSAFYKCKEEGKEEGAVEGLVEVWKGYRTRDLEEAIQDLEYVLGTKLSQRFPDSCDV